MKKTKYVEITVKYFYDENNNRVFEIPEAGQIKQQLCQGWDIDIDENGPFKIECEHEICKEINKKEALESNNSTYAREDLR